MYSTTWIHGFARAPPSCPPSDYPASGWPWHRFGDASKTKRIMSRKQKRTIIIAASSTILATVMKTKKKKRRISCCVRTWVSEGRILVRPSLMYTFGPSTFRRFAFFRIKSVRLTRRTNFAMMVRGLFAWRFPGSRCATLMSFASMTTSTW